MPAAELNVENEILEVNLKALFQYIQRVRREIASLNQAADGVDKFETLGQQLDGIIEATSDASDTIMDAVEKSGEAVEQLATTLTEPDVMELLNRISDSNNRVFEACAFQDITGQRVTKIVKSVTYVEDRVSTLREIWGDKELNKVDVADEVLSEDEKLLNGPQAKAVVFFKEVGEKKLMLRFAHLQRIG